MRRWKVPLGLVIVAAGILAAAGGASGASLRASGAATPSCATSALVIWMNTSGSGAAGSSYYNLEFTNLSSHSCQLRGYPGVSAVGIGGKQIGSAAMREPATGKTVTIASDKTMIAVVQVTDTGNFPSARCRAVTAAGLRVYPPGSTTSKVVPFPFSACSRTATTFLGIEPMTPSSAAQT